MLEKKTFFFFIIMPLQQNNAWQFVYFFFSSLKGRKHNRHGNKNFSEKVETKRFFSLNPFSREEGKTMGGEPMQNKNLFSKNFTPQTRQTFPCPQTWFLQSVGEKKLNQSSLINYFYDEHEKCYANQNRTYKNSGGTA